MSKFLLYDKIEQKTVLGVYADNEHQAWDVLRRSDHWMYWKWPAFTVQYEMVPYTETP